VTIVIITFQVTEETLSSVIEIPPCGERWDKGMPLDVLSIQTPRENQRGRSESVSLGAFPKYFKGD
jgi:hypothetical protein